MKLNDSVRTVLDVAWYLVVFLMIQVLVSLPLGQGCVSAIVSSVLVTALFIWCKWVRLSPAYLRSRQWGVLTWVALFSLGSIIPSEWLQEQLGFEMPKAMEQLFTTMLSEPLAYPAIGVLVPLVEEVVFRGAILRCLLQRFPHVNHWFAILFSAVLFGAVHANWAQFVHALLIGIVLGWMYYRTESILPGMVLHWVNNTVAYLLFHLLPNAHEAKLLDLFQGNERNVWLALLFSLFILLPSLLQLALRLRKAK